MYIAWILRRDWLAPDMRIVWTVRRENMWKKPAFALHNLWLQNKMYAVQQIIGRL